MISTRPRTLATAAIWLFALATAPQARAQPAPLAQPAQAGSAALVGWIRDSAGVPVAQADIRVEGSSAAARADSTGRFAFRGLSAGKTTFSVRRLGFEPQSFELVLHASAVDSISVTMDENARVLAAVRTDAASDRRSIMLDGFYRRKAKGFGVFLTREDIERHHTNVLSETLREVPGIRVVHAGGRSGLRFDSANSKRYDCPPQYWIDGRRVVSTEIDDYPASDVEGIELYRGPSTTPMQFSPGNVVVCGTVVIWTRVPGVGSRP
ncbi:MAG: TonB-dependent receptor plug [Gemmatimonadetes bacterium]|nr:TonB-dependent receptor plug [Gemmatimonadota bacterium]